MTRRSRAFEARDGGVRSVAQNSGIKPKRLLSLIDVGQDGLHSLGRTIEDVHFERALQGIGQLFPGPSKTTRAYTLKEDGIVKAAEACGFKLVRRSLNKAPFYFSRLIEFRKA